MPQPIGAIPERLLMPGVLVRKQPDGVRPSSEAAAGEKDDEGKRVDIVGTHEEGPGDEAAVREKQTAQGEDGGVHEDGLGNAAAFEGESYPVEVSRLMVRSDWTGGII